MAKLTLNDITAGFDATAYNANNTLIEAAIENTLSRDGTTPNQMDADIDLNSYDLNNVNRVNTVELYLNGVKVTGVYPETLTQLGGLSDVDTTGVTNGQVITYNSGSGLWVAGDAASAVADLTDVTLTTLANRHALMYDSGDSRWENRLLVEADISDLGTYLTALSGDGSPTLAADLDAGGFNLTNIGSQGFSLRGDDSGELWLVSNEADLSGLKFINSGLSLEGQIRMTGGNIYIEHSNSEVGLRLLENSGAILYNNNSAQFGVFAAGVGIDQGDRMNFDGYLATGDTYITSGSANVLSFYAGGNEMRWDGTTLTVNGGAVASGGPDLLLMGG